MPCSILLPHVAISASLGKAGNSSVRSLVRSQVLIFPCILPFRSLQTTDPARFASCFVPYRLWVLHGLSPKPDTSPLLFEGGLADGFSLSRDLLHCCSILHLSLVAKQICIPDSSLESSRQDLAEACHRRGNSGRHWSGLARSV